MTTKYFAQEFQERWGDYHFGDDPEVVLHEMGHILERQGRLAIAGRPHLFSFVTELLEPLSKEERERSEVLAATLSLLAARALGLFLGDLVAWKECAREIQYNFETDKGRLRWPRRWRRLSQTSKYLSQAALITTWILRHTRRAKRASR